ncbi:Uncharacterised protein [Mycobacterium tuberculosis]|nr:Uncharacterised protein [Mycobacterium tuberculosis]
MHTPFAASGLARTSTSALVIPSKLSTFPVVRTATCTLVNPFVASSDCLISARSAGSDAVGLTGTPCSSASGFGEEHPDSHNARQAPSTTRTADVTARFPSFICAHYLDCQMGPQAECRLIGSRWA